MIELGINQTQLVSGGDHWADARSQMQAEGIDCAELHRRLHINPFVGIKMLAYLEAAGADVLCMAIFDDNKKAQQWYEACENSTKACIDNLPGIKEDGIIDMLNCIEQNCKPFA